MLIRAKLKMAANVPDDRMEATMRSCLGLTDDDHLSLTSTIDGGDECGADAPFPAAAAGDCHGDAAAGQQRCWRQRTGRDADSQQRGIGGTRGVATHRDGMGAACDARLL